MDRRPRETEVDDLIGGEIAIGNHPDEVGVVFVGAGRGDRELHHGRVGNESDALQTDLA